MSLAGAQLLIPILGILVALIIPVVALVSDYFAKKDKNAAIIEISKNIDDSVKLEGLLEILDERKKEPLDYRRSGVIALFVGIGLFLFGVFFLGSILKGVGALVAAIGVGSIIAGYLYPNTSYEITSSVEKFERK